ncbi:MAG: signal peptidase I [Eubacterium sp.]|nr:signal peptidase I [Eubacterium sp.]
MSKVLKVVVSVLAWIILIAAFVVTLLVFSSNKNNGISNFMGYIPMKVESDSMKPTFEKGDLIICREVDDVKQLKKGDVITFWTIIEGKKALNTHRITEIDDDGTNISFMTRGDGNPENDDLPAFQSDIVGKWTEKSIKKGGVVMGFLQTQKGFFICILIPMAIFFLFELYKFIFAVMEVKKAGNNSDLDEEEIKRRAIEEYLAEKEQEENTAKNSEES